MAKSIIERLENGTIKLTITLPKERVEKARGEAVEALSKGANMPGFRKGKAPSDLVEDKLDQDHVREEVLKHLLPVAYQEAVLEHNLKPIMNPKIHIEKIDDGEDWKLDALTCEVPVVDPGKYKENAQKVTAKGKIIIPGKTEQKASLEEVIKSILEGANVQVPSILVEQEADKLLSQLLSDIKKLGLSLDQYLASTKRSAEDLRAEYAKRAENDIKIEFIIAKISELEKISVGDQEIEEAINKAKSPEEKKHLEENKYMLAAILRQQKTLDFLIGL